MCLRAVVFQRVCVTVKKNVCASKYVPVRAREDYTCVCAGISMGACVCVFVCPHMPHTAMKHTQNFRDLILEQPKKDLQKNKSFLEASKPSTLHKK